MSGDGFAGLDPCVHCGFCLQSCPTYLATGDEADSPRGRIVLMQGLARGQFAPDEPKLAYHLDRCLGCRACEPVCPSGVKYGEALETARQILAESRPVPFVARAVNAVMAEPALRKPLFGLARMIRPMAAALAGKSRIGFAFAMLGATQRATAQGERGERREGMRIKSPPPPPHSPSVSLLTGCIMSGLFSHVNAATERTLAANGYRPTRVPNQVCCGALHAHTGQHVAAVELARRNVAAFAAFPDSLIAVNSAGCGAMLKEYGRLLMGDPLEREAIALAGRVRDVTELLAERGPRRGARVRLRVAYDPPCHLLHAQRIADAPLAVLDAVPGSDRTAHVDADLCCGSAGSYSLTEPELSRSLLDSKVRALTAAAPDAVATGNPGCIMQIGAGLAAAGFRLPVVHPVEILDWSYERAGYYDS